MSEVNRAADLILEAATVVSDSDRRLRDEIIAFAMGLKETRSQVSIELIQRKKGLVASEINETILKCPMTAFVYYQCGILTDETINKDCQTNISVLGCVCATTKERVDELYGISYEEKK